MKSRLVAIGALIVLFIGVSGCQPNSQLRPKQTESPVPLNQSVDLTPEIAKRFALYAAMSANAYRRDERRVRFPVELAGWRLVSESGEELPANSPENSYSPRTWFGKAFSNLQFDIWEHSSDPVTVIAFKGTDEKLDWLGGNLSAPISVPYKSAKKRVRRYIKRNANRSVTVTGHSLGGGIALSVSLWEDVPAVVFNSSPRLFDGFGDKESNSSARKAIYQDGEILQTIRNFYPKFLERIPAKDVVITRFDFQGENLHSGELIAEGLLRCARDDRVLGKIVEALSRVAVSCYLN